MQRFRILFILFSTLLIAVLADITNQIGEVSACCALTSAMVATGVTSYLNLKQEAPNDLLATISAGAAISTFVFAGTATILLPASRVKCIEIAFSIRNTKEYCVNWLRTHGILVRSRRQENSDAITIEIQQDNLGQGGQPSQGNPMQRRRIRDRL